MNKDECKLSDRHCVPCEGGLLPMTPEQYKDLLGETPEWSVTEGKRISRDFKFKNFKESLEFVNKIGEIAEGEGHHPNISLHNWNKVLVTLTTHAVKGLSENDFILASKIDSISASE